MGVCTSSKKIKSNKLKDNNKNYITRFSQNTLYNITKSLCKIVIQSIKEEVFGIGFFIYIKLDKKIPCLMTNFKYITKKLIDSKETIAIQLENKKVINIKLDEKDRFIKHLIQVTNITIIEILDSDFINNNIEILNYELNIDYEKYLNRNIFLLHFSLDEHDYFTMGQIIHIKDFEFEHSINENKNYSGCPIILTENKTIIGISEDKNGINNFGLFIHEILKELDKEKKNNENGNKYNLFFKKESQTYNEKSLLLNNQEINLQNENMHDKISIKYIKFDDDDKIKIFGKEFIENNKSNFKIIINNIEKELCEYLDNIEVKKFDQNIIEIELQQINEPTNLSHMFSGCKNLYSLENSSNLNLSKVTNMNNMFFGCSNLSFISNTSNWDTSNVRNMGDMFSGCSTISSLPDISKFDTSNVTNLSYMFSGCESLSYLPDISKWDTSNVTNLSYLFYWCKSLTYLPDISKWNINNVTDMSWMFFECSSLTELPKLGIWKTNKVVDMNHMFYGCSSLLSLPNISFWDTSNVIDMSYMFSGCINIEEFPEIDQWNTNNVNDTTNIFQGCKNQYKIKFRLVNKKN